MIRVIGKQKVELDFVKNPYAKIVKERKQIISKDYFQPEYCQARSLLYIRCSNLENKPKGESELNLELMRFNTKII
ncbi:hypothetical protein LCGC14_1076330 [marine sediment metagenome]|uniref:Uncharacterized protein n=1 Tax=marine sediment metagenome TaxID=412755 RepID=A0A0F9QME2_9ZZZZ